MHECRGVLRVTPTHIGIDNLSLMFSWPLVRFEIRADAIVPLIPAPVVARKPVLLQQHPTGFTISAVHRRDDSRLLAALDHLLERSLPATNPADFERVSTAGQCNVCGQTSLPKEGRIIPIAVGFMSGFKYLAANTPDGGTVAARQQLLARLLTSSSYRGAMETRTAVCQDCAKLFH